MFLPLLQTRCCNKNICERCNLFSDILDGKIGLDVGEIYKNHITDSSFGYQGSRADRVYLELLVHHGFVKREGDREGVISPAHSFWFEELPKHRGHYCRAPAENDGVFQQNLAIAQGVIKNHVSLAPGDQMATRCCGKVYTIGTKAPIYGHENISESQQCMYLASRVIGDLFKLTNWIGNPDLANGVANWVEWTLARYTTTDVEPDDRCKICYEADTVYELHATQSDRCHHMYCATCLQQWLANVVKCAYCRETPVRITVAPYAYGWEPIDIPQPPNEGGIIIIDDDDDSINDMEDDEDDLIFLETDDDETDLDYIPPQHAMEVGESDDDNDLPTIQTPRRRHRRRPEQGPDFAHRRMRQRQEYVSELMHMDGGDRVRSAAMAGWQYDLIADVELAGHRSESRRMMGHHPYYRLSRQWSRQLRDWYDARFASIIRFDLEVANNYYTCMVCLDVTEQRLFEPACCRRAVCQACINTLAYVTDAKSRFSGRRIVLPRCPCCGFLDPNQTIEHALSLTNPGEVGYEHRLRYWQERLRIAQYLGTRPNWTRAVTEYVGVLGS